LTENLNMAEKLWDLANLVTGFAVVQTLAFIYSLLKRDIKLPNRSAHWWAAIFTSAFTVGYVIAVIWCGSKGWCIDGANSYFWRRVTFGRASTIIMFGLVALLALFGHWRDRPKKPPSAQPS
jgi:hypothetical protein